MHSTGVKCDFAQAFSVAAIALKLENRAKSRFSFEMTIVGRTCQIFSQLRCVYFGLWADT
jgi:hypothetical protein